jgi:hypothetical protein
MRELDSFARLRRFIHHHIERTHWVGADDPPTRRVAVHVDTWRPWFDGRKALRTPWSDIAVATLNSLPDIDEPAARPDTRIVDRPTLLRLSTRLVAEPTDENRVQLLVATPLWGSGTSNGRGPRYAARSLLDERLGPCLATTAELVSSGRFAQAHERFLVRGIGPSFFTKWFWSVGLARALTPPPLIFDQRVRACLDRLTSREWHTTGEHAARDYTDYTDLLQYWATALSQDHELGGVDAGRIELLLFDRGPDCFYEWLAGAPPLVS